MTATKDRTSERHPTRMPNTLLTISTRMHHTRRSTQRMMRRARLPSTAKMLMVVVPIRLNFFLFAGC